MGSRTYPGAPLPCATVLAFLFREHERVRPSRCGFRHRSGPRTIAGMSDEPIAPGQILAGKYAIERVLGQGTMGLVLGARHIALQQPVAIKIMLAGRKVTADHEARFLREARIAAMLKSEHAAKVLDMGTHESGAPYLVMEFLDGLDLAAVLKERGPLQVADAVAYVLQACEAIAEAHALGIVHRDIKPANLFLTKSMDGDCVKVVDFGIAKQMHSDLGLTGTGAALGSPLYMSPEQMNGSRDVDARADIWGLGVTLYELLAQVTPFHADTVMVLMTRVFQSPPTPLEQYRPDVPPRAGGRDPSGPREGSPATLPERRSVRRRARAVRGCILGAARGARREGATSRNRPVAADDRAPGAV